MYIQYIVNVSESQVDTLKDAIRLKKGVTFCFPKGGIRGDHVLLLTSAQINRLGKAQVEGRRVQIRLSARQVAKNVSYTGGSLGVLASLAARAIPLAVRVLPTILSGFTTGLFSGGIDKVIRLVAIVLEMDSICTHNINAIEYRNVKAMVSI